MATGGASGNAGIVQFKDDLGAVANYGSNSVTQLVRDDDFITIGATINLAPGCVNPDSVALTKEHLFVVGTNCAESHAWPSGHVDGTVVGLPDNTAAQIAAGKTWAAVTLKSGYVFQLPLTGRWGAQRDKEFRDAHQRGQQYSVRGGVLGRYSGIHSGPQYRYLRYRGRGPNVYPISGLTFISSNAPCWVAKGPGNLWYTGNSPAMKISIFFSDGQGGAYNKSIPPCRARSTDITVSPDGKWLAVIYTYSSEGYVAVYSIDGYGDLTYVATSPSVSVAAFSGVAFSE